MMHPCLRPAFWLVLLAILWAERPCAAQETRLLGFTDVNYLATQRDVREGFYAGQLVGHLATSLSDRLAFFGEVSASARPAGFAVEVERAILRYAFADFLRLSAGRYHTPVSYWNVAYHHGLWLQTSVSRPEMIRFGSRFLPVHFVGLLAEGTFPSMPLGLSYFAGVGNGRDEQIARAGDAGDANDRRAWLAGALARPMALYGLQVGASFYQDRIGAEEAAVDERIVAVHLAWEKEQPEVLGEYAWVIHDPVAAGAQATSRGMYVQLAYRLPGGWRTLKPYVRLERVDVPDGAPVFSPLDLNYGAVVAGVRYDFALLAALKAEYRRERFEGVGRFGSLYLQVSFTFPGASPGQ